MGIPDPVSVHRDVVFVVDSSACLSGLLPSLLKEYIQPCVEYFSGGKISEITYYGIQNGPIRYGLVTLNPPAATYRPVCTYYPITYSPAKLLKWIQDIKLEGGMVGSSLLLSEGLAAVMELANLMESMRESCLSPVVSIEKHCVLVLNQPPSEDPCVESLKYAGRTPPQMMKLLLEYGLKVSVISPRCLTSLKDLIEKTLPTPSAESEITPLDEFDHSLHPGHLVLLQGFQIPSIKESKKTVQDEKMDTLEQPTPEAPVETNSPAVKDEPDLPIKVEPTLPRSNSPLTFSAASYIKPEPSPTEPTHSTPPSSFTLPTSLSQAKMAVTGQSTNLIASGVAGSSSNPIQIISPLGLPDVKPFTTAFSQSATSLSASVENELANPVLKSEAPSTFAPPPQLSIAQSTPLSTVTSQTLTRTASGGIPSASGGIPSAVGGSQPNLEKAMIAAQMAVRMASNQTSNSAAPQQQRSGSIPGGQSQANIGAGPQAGIGTGPQTSLGMGQNQQGAQQQTFGNNMTSVNKPVGTNQDFQRVPTPPMASSVMSQAPPSSMVQTTNQSTFSQGQQPGGQVPQLQTGPIQQQPGGQPQQMTQQQQPMLQQQQQMMARPATIWNGLMEMIDNQRQMRQIRCSVITNKNDVIQDVQPQTWPQKMTMNAYPKVMFNSIMAGMDFNRGSTQNLKTVTFQFSEPAQNVSMLKQLMAVETAIKTFAIVHLVGANTTACPIKALVLVWNDKNKQFTGLIPLEQEKFVAVVKQVVIHRQKQQLAQQQAAAQQQAQQQGALGLQTSGPQMAQSFSQQSSSFTQPSSLQQPQMTMAGNQQAQASNVGMMGQQNQGGMMNQRPGMMGQGQQQGFAQGGMMGQQSQTQNQGGMMQRPQGQGMMSQQAQGGLQTQMQGQGLMGQQQPQQGIMNQQQQGQRPQAQLQNQGMMGQQGQGMMQSQQQQQQGIGQQQSQGMIGQQQQQGQGQQPTQMQSQGMMQGQQQQGMGQSQQLQGQSIMGQQQQGIMGQQQQQQGQGMMGQQGSMMNQQSQGQQSFGQGGMMGQQQQQMGQQQSQPQQQGQGLMGQQSQPPVQQQASNQQERVEKFLKLLISSKPEQHEALFQRLQIKTPEQKQQWLMKANQYRQQVLQQAQNRMMMTGGTQQGMQQQLQMGHGMQQPRNPGGQVFNRPGVPQNMGGIRQQMPPQQQQQHMQPGYNQWQGQQH